MVGRRTGRSERPRRFATVSLILALCVLPAVSQAAIKGDRSLKQIKPFDEAPIREGIATVHKDGECLVQFVVAKTGKASSIVVDCSVPEMAPFVARAVSGAEWEPEMALGKPLDSLAQRQPFRFGSYTAVDPRGEKAPVLVQAIDNNELRRLFEKTPGKLEGCDATFTVGVDGRPKNIATNCKPPTLDDGVAAVIGRMQYLTGEKDGKLVDWPGMQMPMVFIELTRSGAQ